MILSYPSLSSFGNMLAVSLNHYPFSNFSSIYCWYTISCCNIFHFATTKIVIHLIYFFANKDFCTTVGQLNRFYFRIVENFVFPTVSEKYLSIIILVTFSSKIVMIANIEISNWFEIDLFSKSNVTINKIFLDSHTQCDISTLTVTYSTKVAIR